MSETTDFCLFGDTLRKYTGTEKDVVIPDGVTIIDQKAFSECRKIKSVTIPASVRQIRYLSFENCKALKTIYLHAAEVAIGDHAFKGCSKLSAIRGLGVTFMGDIFSLSKKNEVVMPLVFPKVNLSSAKNIYYKISLCMGYILEPEVYAGRGLSGYKKFLEENRDLVLETAKRHNITQVTDLLEPAAANPQEEPEEKIGIDQMSVAAAKEIFEVQNKKTGVKICWYKGTETIVDIPRIIGKTAVALVSPDAFPDDKIVRCNAKTFEKLSLPVQFNTYMAFLKGEVKFSVEQQNAMEAYFQKKQYALLEGAVELHHAGMVNLLLERPLKLEEYESLLEKAQVAGEAQITAKIVEAKDKAFTPEEAEAIHTEETEKELGFREKNLADYRKTFSIYRNKVENPGEAQYSIVNLKQALTDVEVPAEIDGGLVDLYWKAFAKNETMETLILCDGITTIGYGTAQGCKKLRLVRIPGSVVEIGNMSFSGCSPELTIYAPAGSYAETYAKENNIPFVAE